MAFFVVVARLASLMLDAYPGHSVILAAPVADSPSRLWWPGSANQDIFAITIVQPLPALFVIAVFYLTGLV